MTTLILRSVSSLQRRHASRRMAKGEVASILRDTHIACGDAGPQDEVGDFVSGAKTS